MAHQFKNDLAGFKADLEGIAIEENPALVKQKSRDFFWYSPVLKRQLDHVTADLIVTPKDEAEVVRIMKAAFAHDVPITARGGGTGNYGQAMPLSGGAVLNLAELNKVKSITPGSVVAETGAIVAQIDKETRAHSQQELRMHPSTANTASIGGFVAGGSGGVGSIRWGGLRNLGNVIRLRVVTAEAEPRTLDLTGWDLHKAVHAYGTNGVITEVEMPLTAAYDWVDVLVGFDDWMTAVRYADELAHADGLLLKEIAPIAAPVPHDYFLRHQKFIRREQSVVVLMVAPQSMDAFLAFTQRAKGEVLIRYDQASPADLKGLPPAFELCWNHTTLRALRVDPSITYLQTLYSPPDHIEKIETMTRIFGDEVPGHLEFNRFDGRIAASGLSLVRFTTEARLEEIIRIHEDHGCPIFNPHRYTLEEGGMKQTDEIQLAFKKEVDPKGLLNPGKMIAWEDPNYDYRSQKTYLFPGLQQAS
ncbi:FAD-binding oxidoreductase [Kaistia dalseonensis]|uniref:FAD/FMN-containing dehydrogenase n=1 Tax=Kaistia dalseonensis TaxID=410840 RepID=A0ABU0HAV1_9HYPH|nr:FAD-binding oxidoreductase [Kaistia dalseonensis]MCX5496823.1 FAD-binding oxidoreductase [Kaistia dalseonensis]MDQ0439449.1 FAD/FMN-containing dehydrogenase [Kaistia dalseonensis]